MSKFEPLFDAHAIEQLVLAVQFANPLPSDQLQLAMKATDAFHADLPVSNPIHTVSFGFAIGQAVAVPSPTLTPNGQHLTTKTASNGQADEELRVETQQITFASRSYTRWADVGGRASKYFSALIPHYSKCGPVRGISLAYVDKFFWDGAEEAADPRLLLREGSRWLAPHILDTPNLWHSHTGLFVRFDDQTRRLININADCVDQLIRGESKRVVSITTNLTDSFGQAGYAVSSVPATELATFVCSRLDLLHGESKSLLTGVITDAMCRRIGLDTTQ
jgi:uncharacterized protein (TIGR04255 family)